MQVWAGPGIDAPLNPARVTILRSGTGLTMSASDRFWENKSLSEMSKSEWESLCDGCGLCCLHKLRDEDTDTLMHTNVACRLLDLETCQCSSYESRFRKVPDCIALTPQIVSEIDWLPPSCAYRLVHEGQTLPDWHPLLTGRRESVHKAGVSGRGRIISERRAGPLETHIVDWPGRKPKVQKAEPRSSRRKKSA